MICHFVILVLDTYHIYHVPFMHEVRFCIVIQKNTSFVNHILGNFCCEGLTFRQKRREEKEPSILGL